MNRRLLWPLLAVAIAILLWTFRPNTAENSPGGPPETAADAAASAGADSGATNDESATDENAAPQADGPASAERQSLRSMTQVLADYAQGQRSLDELLRHLQSTGQDPFVARDKNAETGEMTIVRTKSPLVGTRYFHAQYFKNSDGKVFPQHMSFEYRPSPKAMDEAIAIARATFGARLEEQRRPDFISWELPHCTLWIKKMSAEDLQDDPMNAYSPEDVGTVRVACEVNPHPQDVKHEP